MPFHEAPILPPPPHVKVAVDKPRAKTRVQEQERAQRQKSLNALAAKGITDAKALQARAAARASLVPAGDPARPAWMNTHVIDPSWKTATVQADAPAADPITTVQDHVDKLLPIVFDAKHLDSARRARSLTIDARRYSFSSDVDNWIDGLETFIAAIIDTLNQAGLALAGAQTADVMKLRSAIGGIPANVRDPQYQIIPEKLLAHLHEDVQNMTAQHLGAIQSVLGDVLGHEHVRIDQDLYAEQQLRDGELDVPWEVIDAQFDITGSIANRITSAELHGFNPCAFLTAAEVRAEDAHRARRGLGPLAES